YRTSQLHCHPHPTLLLRMVASLLSRSFSSFFHCHRAPRSLHSFPTRRSSDLNPSPARVVRPAVAPMRKPLPRASAKAQIRSCTRDRKSTRLNSSHQIISYAVFCLKKKKKKRTRTSARTQHTHTELHSSTIPPS